MDNWELLHAVSTGLLGSMVLLNLLLMALLLLSHHSKQLALDLTQLVHNLLWAPVSLLGGMPPETFAFLAILPNGPPKSSSKSVLKSPLLRLVILSMLTQREPWKRFDWVTYFIGAYVINAWLPATQFTHEPQDPFRLRIEQRSTTLSPFDAEENRPGKEILGFLASRSKLRLTITACLLYIIYIRQLSAVVVVLFVTLAFSMERLYLASLISHFGPWLSFKFEANEQILVKIIYFSVEFLVLVFMLFAHVSSVPFVLALCINILLTCRAIHNDVFRQYLNDISPLQNFARASASRLTRYDDVCAICLSSLHSGRVTSCGHIFHGQCLRRSLESRRTCPMCKTELIH